jgi:arginyl-tRNA synthetase
MRPDALAQEVAKLLTPLIPEAAGLDVAAVAALLAPPPKPELGEFAFPCFRLAKPLGSPPPKIAAQLAEQIAKLDSPLIAAATPAGPYLNLRLHAHEAGRILLPAWARGEAPEYAHSDQKVMVEYSQPNTHKEFHVGHMRNLCLGDSIVRLLRATGHEVVAANYLGDVGTHVAKCLWGMQYFGSEDLPEHGRGEWLGKIYARASIQLEDWGDEDERYKDARVQMSEILRQIEGRKGEYYELWLRTRQWSLDEFDEIYAWAGVHFDRVFYESEVDEPSLRLVDEYLAKGVFVESRGAVGIENPEVKHMPFFMLRKSDGTGLYATKDLALARIKFEEFGIDRSIYVVDARQSDHFRQVFLTLKKMGFEQAERCEHVAYEMVELPEGAMASRKGNVITFRALREQLAATLESTFFHPFRGKRPDADIDQVIHQVSLGAIKYGMLARDNNQKIVFDMAEWTKIVGGDMGPSLQYVTARSASLLRKAGERGLVIDAALLAGEAPLSAGTLEELPERALLQQLIDLPGAVAQAGYALRPSILCARLLGLAHAYNHFQQKLNVIRQTDQGVVQARLLLVQATRNALAWGLSLLGIPAPEWM